MSKPRKLPTVAEVTNKINSAVIEFPIKANDASLSLHDKRELYIELDELHTAGQIKLKRKQKKMGFFHKNAATMLKTSLNNLHAVLNTHKNLKTIDQDDLKQSAHKLITLMQTGKDVDLNTATDLIASYQGDKCALVAEIQKQVADDSSISNLEKSRLGKITDVYRAIAGYRP